MAKKKERDPRDFSLYGGDIYSDHEKHALYLKTLHLDSMLRDTIPCRQVKTRSGRKVRTAATVPLTELELTLLLEALDAFERRPEPGFSQTLMLHVDSLRARFHYAKEGRQ